MNYGYMYPTKDDAFATDRKITFSYFQFFIFKKKKIKNIHTLSHKPKEHQNTLHSKQCYQVTD